MAKSITEINALVVGVNGSIREIIISMLRSLNVKAVHTAKGQAQCFEVLAAENIDLIICGWVPDKLDALTILKKVRDNEATQQTPFVIISSMMEQSLIKQAVVSGVSEYLIPPLIKRFLNLEYVRHCSSLFLKQLQTLNMNLTRRDFHRYPTLLN